MHDLDHGPALDRTTQLTRGLHWLLAAQGDALAAVLRGHQHDPAAAAAALRAPGPVWRSRTGHWVVAARAAAATALDHPGLAQPPLAGALSTVDVAARDAVLSGAPAEFDAADLAWRSAVAALGGDPADPEWAAAAPVLDAALAPPRPAVARALATSGVAPVAAAAARLGAALAADALALRLAGDGSDEAALLAAVHAGEPVVQLVLTTATTDVALAGEQVAPGESVVIALCAANRDPEGAGAPLLPGGPLAAPLAFAHAHAEAVLTALPESLRPTGPAVRASRAPVTRPLVRLPVAR
ncbi:cytochrome P450 family protein [Actinokineospora bangkokensis]|nr:hypothetical protein [Actinokineospora bangkokensis]